MPGERRGLSSRTKEEAARGRTIGVSLPSEFTHELRGPLHAIAKNGSIAVDIRVPRREISGWNNILVREPDAGKPPVRFDEREVETARTAPPLDSTLTFLPCVSLSLVAASPGSYIQNAQISKGRSNATSVSVGHDLCCGGGA